MIKPNLYIPLNVVHSYQLGGTVAKNLDLSRV